MPLRIFATLSLLAVTFICVPAPARGQVAYVVNSAGSTISGYTIDATTGGLTEIPVHPSRRTCWSCIDDGAPDRELRLCGQCHEQRHFGLRDRRHHRHANGDCRLAVRRGTGSSGCYLQRPGQPSRLIDPTPARSSTPRRGSSLRPTACAPSLRP